MERKYHDEAFVELRNKYEQRKKDEERLKSQIPNDIANGFVEIDGYKIDFADRTIKECMQICMPINFSIMPPHYVELKYPAYKNQEKLIYSNEETTINIAFDIRDREMTAGETDDARDQVAELIHKLHPSSEITNKNRIQFADGFASCFEIVTPSLDRDIFNLMFLFELHGNLAVGTFNCYQSEMHNWAEIARQMVGSIKKL